VLVAPAGVEPSCEWVSLRVEVAAAAADAVANFLLEQGAPGVVTAEHDVGDPPLVPGRARLEAPFPATEHARVAAALGRYLASLGALDPALRPACVETVHVPHVDWTEVYRRHHRPVWVGRRLLVAPPWNVPPAPRREVLVIEPGMAFGTGQHATTRGCLEAIEAVVHTGSIRSALDVGTGTGVLAAALARLGVPRVIACDADPSVLPLARANLEHNGATQVLLFGGTAGGVRGTFDLVVANLLAAAIVAEADTLAATVAPRGHLIVSGLLDEQTPAVRAAYPAWTVVGARLAEGWHTLTLVRDARRLSG
jgi:ribosomal protein L11 methyltransferase